LLASITRSGAGVQEEQVMRVTWYTAMSMDGRIAGAGDDLDFLSRIDAEGEHGDWERFAETIDAVVIGSGTLRWLHREGHLLPLRGKPIWLVSHDEELAARAAAADPSSTPVERVAGDVATILDRIEAAGHEHVWIGGGGAIAGQALAADRVDEVIVTVAPTALGSGPALFDQAELPPRLFALAECRPYGKNAVRLRWIRDRTSEA
jgi:riboflavin biosynthesis pyrimidine reductase